VRIVAALGGNALLQRHETPGEDVQRRHIAAAVAALLPLARDHQLVITHGNGPQVGLLAMESADDHTLAGAYPFDVLGAQTQGMIGYWLLQALHNALPAGRQVASVITQTLVSSADPAFAHPTKFVGPSYAEADARARAASADWDIAPDGDAWRRVVPSPAPLAVVETPLIRRLVDLGIVVVCAGGGGAPVVRGPTGDLEGADAVVDKDGTSALLGAALEADVLLLLTDVAQVEQGYGTPGAALIHRATPTELRQLPFPAGSMGPKVEAVCRFVELTGGTAAIGALEDVEAIMAGTAGTIVTPSGRYP
jgi:carbamate kinase